MNKIYRGWMEEGFKYHTLNKVATPVLSLNESFQKFNVKVAIKLRDNQCQLCLTNYSVVYTTPAENQFH